MLFLFRAVLLRLVTALACVVVLVVVAALLMGCATLAADLRRAACIGVSLIVLAVRMSRDAGLIRIASVAFAAHDFFSCCRF